MMVLRILFGFALVLAITACSENSDASQKEPTESESAPVKNAPSLKNGITFDEHTFQINRDSVRIYNLSTFHIIGEIKRLMNGDKKILVDDVKNEKVRIRNNKGRWIETTLGTFLENE